MWRPTLVPALVAGLLIGGGCQDPVAEERIGDPLEVSVAPARESVAYGDTVTFVITVANTSIHDITVSGSTTCIIGYRVRDSKGEVVNASDRVCTHDIRGFVIPPEGVMVRRMLFRGHTYRSQYDLLPPGQYTVTGALNAREGERLSTHVPFRVLPP